MSRRARKIKKKLIRYWKDLRKHPKKLATLVFMIVVGISLVTACSVAAQKYQDHRAALRLEKQHYSATRTDIDNLALDIQGSVQQQGKVDNYQRCDKSPKPPTDLPYVCTVGTSLQFETDPLTLQNMIQAIDGLIQTRGDVFTFDSYLNSWQPFAVTGTMAATEKAETFTHVVSQLHCSAEYVTPNAADASGLYALTVRINCSGLASSKYY